MMNQAKNKAFTLVELIVVITILAILGTIAFISLQGYSRDARDSVRQSNIANISQSLTLFETQKGIYPDPTGGVDITYSGSSIWIQGTIGDSVISNLSQLSIKPIDPLTSSEYTYSRLNTKKEFELAAAMEGSISYNQNIISNTYAAKQKAFAYVKGNYNGQILKTIVGTNTYILAVPSLITNNITTTNILDIINSGSLVYNGQNNLPYSYSESIFDINGGFDYTNNDIVIYSELSSTINNTLQTSENKRLEFLEKLQKYYKTTPLKIEVNLNQLVNILIDKNEPSKEVKFLSISGIKKISSASISTIIVEDTVLPDPYIGCTASGQILEAASVYGSCNSLDLTVCSGVGTGYTVAACNVGTNISGTGSDSYGDLFQWGRNKGFSHSDISLELNLIPASSYDADYDTFGFVGSGTMTNWIIPGNGDLWGNVTDTILARQGPCEVGYHVPTPDEGQGIITAGGWSNPGAGTQLMNDMNFPAAGYRTAGLPNVISGPPGTNGYYLSSVPGITMWISIPSVLWQSTGFPLSTAASVRCFKN